MLTTAQLKQAVQISEKLDVLKSELASIMSGSGSTKAKSVKAPKAPKAKKAKKGKSNMSPEGREKIAAAQRKRWAKQKKAAKKEG